MHAATPRIRPALVVCCCCLLAAFPLLADEQDKLKVGPQPDGRIVVPTNQILKPAGKQVTFPGRPVALAFADGDKMLVVQNMKGLVFIDVATAKIKQTLPSPTGLSVTGLMVFGQRVWVSDAKDRVHVAEKQEGSYKWDEVLELARPKVGGAAHPAGMSIDSHYDLWVASTRGNSVQRIDRNTGLGSTLSPGPCCSRPWPECSVPRRGDWTSGAAPSLDPGPAFSRSRRSSAMTRSRPCHWMNCMA